MSIDEKRAPLTEATDSGKSVTQTSTGFMQGLMMKVGSRNGMFAGVSVASNELVVTSIVLSGWWYFIPHTNWKTVCAVSFGVVTLRSSHREESHVTCGDRLNQLLVVWRHRHQATVQLTLMHWRHFLKEVGGILASTAGSGWSRLIAFTWMVVISRVLSWSASSPGRQPVERHRRRRRLNHFQCDYEKSVLVKLLLSLLFMTF